MRTQNIKFYKKILNRCILEFFPDVVVNNVQNRTNCYLIDFRWNCVKCGLAERLWLF
jgi:hypothetical protein